MIDRTMFRWRPIAATLIVLLAFAIRIYRLDQLPPGLFYDEAYNVLDGLDVLNNGYHPVFFLGNNGREPFYIYLQSLFIWAGGASPYVVRWCSVLLGTLTVALTYPLARRLLADMDDGRRDTAALLAMFFLATLQWHINFSRIGFRAISQPFLEALAIYLLYRGAQQLALASDFGASAAGGSTSSSSLRATQPSISSRFWPVWFILGGGALGLSLYTYLSSRLLPAAVVALLVIAAIWGQRITLRYFGGLLLSALSCVAVGAPLAIFYARHPDVFFGHAEDVSLLQYGGLPALWESALRIAGMFNWAGDVNWRHNLPGRPAFDLIAGLFFLVGIAVVVSRLRQSWRRHGARIPSGYLALVVIVPVMLLPSLFSEGAPHFLRGIGALPFLVLFPAIGLEAVWQRAGWRSTSHSRLRSRGLNAVSAQPNDPAGVPESTSIEHAETARQHIPPVGATARMRLVAVLLALALAFTAATTFKAYFLDWGSSQDPYYHFDARYFDLARYLKSKAQSSRVYLSPWLAKHATLRLLLRDLPYAAFDSDRSIVLTSSDALYVFEEGGADKLTAPAFPAKVPVPLQAEHLADRYGRPAFGFYRLPSAMSPLSGDFFAKGAPFFGLLERPKDNSPSASFDFGNALSLIGWVVGPQEGRVAGDTVVTAGITLPVTLMWRATKTIADNYTVSLRLTDRNGRLWQQFDSLAGGAVFPTSQWHSDELIVDRAGLLVPPDLPPGDYHIDAGVYSLAGKRSLNVQLAGEARGELASLGVVKVLRPGAGALAAMHPPLVLNAPFGSEITLLGVGLSTSDVKPGESFDLDLFWKSERDINRELSVDVSLLDSGGGKVASLLAPPTDGSYPTSRWRSGDALRDPRRLSIAAKAAPGATQLRIAVFDQSSGVTLAAVSLSGPTISGRTRQIAPLPPRFSHVAAFGDRLALLGFSSDLSTLAGAGTDLPKIIAEPGGSLSLTLSWRCVLETETSYTVFVQVLDAEGKLVAQHDGLPQDGAAPTSSWLREEVVADPISIALRPELPAGDYTLIAGLYNALDGKRLPVGDSDFVKLALVKISGR